jgi:hypothetical protein
MSEADESMQKFKDAIARGGAERAEAFQLLETQFGAQLRAGGKGAIIVFQHLSHLAEQAGGPDASAEFHRQFYNLLPRIAQNDLKFSGFSQSVKQEVENLQKKPEKPGLFSRILLGRR